MLQSPFGDRNVPKLVRLETRLQNKSRLKTIIVWGRRRWEQQMPYWNNGRLTVYWLHFPPPGPVQAAALCSTMLMSSFISLPWIWWYIMSPFLGIWCYVYHKTDLVWEHLPVTWQWARRVTQRTSMENMKRSKVTVSCCLEHWRLCWGSNQMCWFWPFTLL